MSERKMKTTQDLNKDKANKISEYMKRMNTTGKEYNPAPKESKSNGGKVQK